MFSNLPRSANRPSLKDILRAKLHLEPLEDRFLPSTNSVIAASISGYVYQDANNNGVKDAGELPIANSTLELHDAQGALIATTTSGADGYYKFDQNSTIDQTPATLTKTIDFPTTATDYTLTGQLDQFNPALGQLQSVEVIHAGSITSEIKVENTSPVSISTIHGTVGGTINLQAPGVNSDLTLSENAGSFDAGIFDASKDYTGSSGTSFGPKTADGQNSFSLTGADITPYIGIGQVTVTESAHASSNASGGGNLDVSLNSSGQSQVTVIYHYIPNNSLQPGDYTIVQNPQPAGFLDGKESQNGVVLNNPPGTDAIAVTLTNGASANNNFGEIVPAGISGFVYHDANNDGVKDAGEDPIAGATITLVASDQSTQTATTDATGFYQFTDLAPDTYTLQETQPAGFIDGTDMAGSLGGTVTNDQIAGINLPSGGKANDNNFGELKAASLAGFVYADGNNDGIKDPGEAGIPGVTVSLTGFDDQGPVAKDATTDADGAYQFVDLRPGTYALTETQPAGFNDGKDTIGSQGGTIADDVFSAIALASGTAGANNNFGEITPEVADLGIVKTANAASAVIGGQLGYTLTVQNYGTFTAKNVEVTETLPTGAQLLSAAGDGWTITNTPGGFTATRPELSVGAVSQIGLTIKVPGLSSSITNKTSVTSSTPDNDPSNNTSQVTTPVTLPPVKTKAIPFGGLPIISKSQLFVNGGNFLPPAIRGQLAFVDGAYRTALGRPATSAEAMAGIAQLKSGTSRDAIVNNLWFSSEHAAVEAGQLYQQYLHRDPTAAELVDTAVALSVGTSEIDLATNLLTSQEYQDAHPGAQEFVGGLFRDVLNRLPDPQMQQDLVQALNTQTTAQIAQSMLTSQDGLARMVDDGFRTVLRRPATTAEIQSYSAQLAAKTLTPGGLAQQLLASAEFFQLAYASEI